MKRRTKWILGIIIILFLVGSLAISIAGKLIFEQKVGEILQRKVHLGSLGLNLLTGKVKLKNLEIPNEEGFQEKNLFRMKKFSLRVSLLPLISRRIVIQKIFILKPEITVERDKKGRINIEELIKKLTKGEGKEKGKGKGAPPALPLPDFSLKKLILKKGEIIFADGKVAQPPFISKIDNIMVTVTGFSTQLPPDSLGTEFKMEANLSTPHPAQIKSWGRGNFLGEKISFESNFELQKLEIPHFSPYYKEQLPATVASGTFSVNSKTSCKKSILDSRNHILIQDLNLIPYKKGKRTFLGVPISQIVEFLKSNQGRIEFDSPVTGDLKDPKYSLLSVVRQVLGHAFKEKLGEPLKKVGKKVGKEVEKGGEYLGGKLDKLFRKRKPKK
jgi:hypothetical protein